MPRGPHDDEIKGGDAETDRARQRLEEFLKQRGPQPPPPKDHDQDDGENPPSE